MKLTNPKNQVGDNLITRKEMLTGNNSWSGGNTFTTQNTSFMGGGSPGQYMTMLDSSGKIGWQSIPNASETTNGMAKLYTGFGYSDDGSVSQSAITMAMDQKANLELPRFNGLEVTLDNGFLSFYKGQELQGYISSPESGGIQYNDLTVGEGINIVFTINDQSRPSDGILKPCFTLDTPLIFGNAGRGRNDYTGFIEALPWDTEYGSRLEFGIYDHAVSGQSDVYMTIQGHPTRVTDPPAPVGVVIPVSFFNLPWGTAPGVPTPGYVLSLKDTSGAVEWVPGGGSVPDASSSAKGIAKLYDTLGTNSDGSVNQLAITSAMGAKFNNGGGNIVTGNSTFKIGPWGGNQIGDMLQFDTTSMYYYYIASSENNNNLVIGGGYAGTIMTFGHEPREIKAHMPLNLDEHIRFSDKTGKKFAGISNTGSSLKFTIGQYSTSNPEPDTWTVVAEILPSGSGLPDRIQFNPSNTFITGAPADGYVLTSRYTSGNIEWRPGGGSVPDATPNVKGITKLYTGLGPNSDGSVSQEGIANALQGYTNTSTAYTWTYSQKMPSVVFTNTGTHIGSDTSDNGNGFQMFGNHKRIARSRTDGDNRGILLFEEGFGFTGLGNMTSSTPGGAIIGDTAGYGMRFGYYNHEAKFSNAVTLRSETITSGGPRRTVLRLESDTKLFYKGPTGSNNTGKILGVTDDMGEVGFIDPNSLGGGGETYKCRFYIHPYSANNFKLYDTPITDMYAALEHAFQYSEDWQTDSYRSADQYTVTKGFVIKKGERFMAKYALTCGSDIPTLIPTMPPETTGAPTGMIETTTVPDTTEVETTEVGTTEVGTTEVGTTELETTDVGTISAYSSKANGFNDKSGDILGDDELSIDAKGVLFDIGQIPSTLADARAVPPTMYDSIRITIGFGITDSHGTRIHYGTHSHYVSYDAFVDNNWILDSCSIIADGDVNVPAGSKIYLSFGIYVDPYPDGGRGNTVKIYVGPGACEPIFAFMGNTSQRVDAGDVWVYPNGLPPSNSDSSYPNYGYPNSTTVPTLNLASYIGDLEKRLADGGGGASAPNASPTTKGIAKLYQVTGTNSDGAMSQYATYLAMDMRMNTSATNADSLARATMANASMPGSSATLLSLPSHEGNLTAPNDGYLTWSRQATSGQYISIQSQGVSVRATATGTHLLEIFLPVKKGAAVAFWYTASGGSASNINYLRFVKSNGAQ